MEEMHKGRYVGRGKELPCPFWTHHSPSISKCSPTQKLSETLRTPSAGISGKFHYVGIQTISDEVTLTPLSSLDVRR